MPGVLLDTSVYIDALRSGNDVMLRARHMAGGNAVWLSAVVLEELYAGAEGRALRAVEKLEYDFEKAGRILVPNKNDWASAGKILARLGAEFDYELIGRTRIANDALIAMTAARTATTVITHNKRDFARLAKLRPFSWQAIGI
jgi:predicted nucleic acid-binding protein